MKKNKFNYEINIFGLGYKCLTLVAKILSLKKLLNGYDINKKNFKLIKFKKKNIF